MIADYSIIASVSTLLHCKRCSGVYWDPSQLKPVLLGRISQQSYDP